MSSCQAFESKSLCQAPFNVVNLQQADNLSRFSVKECPNTYFCCRSQVNDSAAATKLENSRGSNSDLITETNRKFATGVVSVVLRNPRDPARGHFNLDFTKNYEISSRPMVGRPSIAFHCLPLPWLYCLIENFSAGCLLK